MAAALWGMEEASQRGRASQNQIEQQVRAGRRSFRSIASARRCLKRAGRERRNGFVGAVPKVDLLVVLAGAGKLRASLDSSLIIELADVSTHSHSPELESKLFLSSRLSGQPTNREQIAATSSREWRRRPGFIQGRTISESGTPPRNRTRARNIEPGGARGASWRFLTPGAHSSRARVLISAS